LVLLVTPAHCNHHLFF